MAGSAARRHPSHGHSAWAVLLDVSQCRHAGANAAGALAWLQADWAGRDQAALGLGGLRRGLGAFVRPAPREGLDDRPAGYWGCLRDGEDAGA